MIADNKSGLEFLNSIRDGSFKLGLPVGCALDEFLRYKQGSFNVMAGHANVGKTKFILYYYLLLAVKHGKKFLIFSSENTIGGIKRDLIQLYSRKPIKQLSDVDFQYYFEWVNAHFQFIDFEHFYNIEKRFMNFRDVFRVALEDCTHFDALVIDPYNSLAECEDIKGNKHEKDYQVASEFRMFCKQNKKTIYLLAHGNTDALRKQYAKNHEYEGHPIPLMAADIEGGGKWVNRADDFIVIHRLTQHSIEWKNTEIHVKKVKETETGGRTTFIDSPVLFQLQEDGLSFKCGLRETAGITPTVMIDPLEESKPKEPQPTKQDIQTALKPNREFEQPKKVEVKAFQKDDDELFTFNEMWE